MTGIALASGMVSAGTRRFRGQNCAFERVEQRQIAGAGTGERSNKTMHGAPSDVPVDRHDGGEDGGTRRNQTPHRSRQAGDAFAGLQRLPDESRAQRTWQPDAKYHGKAADLVFQSDPLANQLLASDDQ